MSAYEASDRRNFKVFFRRKESKQVKDKSVQCFTLERCCVDCMAVITIQQYHMERNKILGGLVYFDLFGI